MDSNFIKTVPPLEIKENPQGLGDEFFNCMKKNSKMIMQIDGKTGHEDTYGDVLKRGIKTAIGLQKRRLTSEDIVCLCTNNHLDCFVPIIAGLFLGAKVAPLDCNMSSEMGKHLLSQIRPKIIFSSVNCLRVLEDSLEEIKLSSEVVVFDRSLDKDDRRLDKDDGKYIRFEDFITDTSEEDSFRPVKITKDRETAFILFSSGTTGMPKGICLSHYSLARNAIVVAQYRKHCQDDLLISYSTNAWISTIGFLAVQIFSGSCRLVFPKYDPKEFWAAVQKYPVTSIMLSATRLSDIIKNKNEDSSLLSGVKIGIGGSAIYPHQLLHARKHLPEATIYQGYGLTEVGGVAAYINLTHPDGLRFSQEKLASCGMAVAGISYKVVDLETGKLLGPGQKGELRLKTDHQMNGFYDRISSSHSRSSSCQVSSCRDSSCRDSTCRNCSCRDFTCRDSSCRDSSCRDSTCRDSSCQDSSCRDSSCRDSSCRESACRNSSYRDSSCRNSLCRDSSCRDSSFRDSSCRDSSPWDEEGWLKTGDIVYYDEDHCFYHVERIKELLKYRNYCVYPAFLESILKQHPAVLSAVVIGIPHPEDGDHAVGVVVLDEDHAEGRSEDGLSEEIKKFVEEKVNDFEKLVGGVRVVKTIPMSAGGKVNRVELKKFIIDLL